MKKCPYCAEDIQNEAIVCRYCGRDIPQLTPVKAVEGIEAATVIGTKRKKPSKKATLTCMGVIVSLCVILGIASTIYSATPAGKLAATERALTALVSPTPKNTSTPKNSATPRSTATPENTPTPMIDANVKIIMDGTGLTEEEAKAAFAVVRSVGFKQVNSLEFVSETSDFKVYQADMGYTKTFRIGIADGKVVVIDSPQVTYYDTAKGGVVDLITNYTLDSSDELDFMFMAEEHVKLALKAPSTAEFPRHIFERDQWIVAREKDIVWVQSWVDAQNSFGAMIRNNFTLQYSFSTKDLLFMELGGEIVFGTLQTP